MIVYGIDFTSRPTRRKPITCAVCVLTGDRLVYQGLQKLTTFEQFEASLAAPGPWIAGMDFPFGQSQRFVQNIGWPDNWRGYVTHVAGLDRATFRQTLDDYRKPRPAGDKEHRRSSDAVTGAISPQKLYGVPVGLMFFAGAKRLLASGATVAGLYDADSSRVVFEAYPGVLARRATSWGYKSDDVKKQTDDHRRARADILTFVTDGGVREHYGVDVVLARKIEDDATGDTLDALLCAVQAAWAWRAWPELRPRLSPIQQLEGWIADPCVFD